MTGNEILLHEIEKRCGPLAPDHSTSRPADKWHIIPDKEDAEYIEATLLLYFGHEIERDIEGDLHFSSKLQPRARRYILLHYSARSAVNLEAGPTQLNLTLLRMLLSGGMHVKTR